jgi:AcrR family transcriptional regulator
MAGGVASVSIPAVAREASVSVPTIYRHFGTKRDLLAAVYPHLARRVSLDRVPDPRSLEDLRDGIRAIFDRLDAFDDLARAAAASPAAEEARHVTMPDRVERIRRFLDSIAPSLAEFDRDRIARLLMILTTSSALRVWRDHLGSSVDEAADDIDWLVRVAIASDSSRDRR